VRRALRRHGKLAVDDDTATAGEIDSEASLLLFCADE
jgi:hypothetical protein